MTVNTQDKITKVSTALTELCEKQVKEFCDMEGKKPGQWSKHAGQWIVYGLERQLGFFKTVELCAVVERAWKAKKPMGPGITELVTQWLAPKDGSSD